MVVDILLAAVVAVLALPALVLGAARLLRHDGPIGSDLGGDLASRVVLVLLRLLALLLLLGAAGLTLVSTIGAAIKGVELHGFVYVFFVLSVLLAALVLLTFARRPRHRRATPARR